jgi:hypothetical protein
MIKYNKTNKERIINFKLISNFKDNKFSKVWQTLLTLIKMKNIVFYIF